MSTTTTTSRSKPDQFDIGAVMSAPAKDPQWLSKCLVMGLLMLIPIAGTLNLSGWTKAVADRRAEGDPLLPDANLSYIGHGWRLFLAWLPLVAIVMVGFGVMGGGVAVVAVSASQNGGSMGGVEGIILAVVMVMYAGILLFSMVATVVGPAVNFLHIVDGERFSSLAFKKQWEVMKEGGVQYLLFFVAILLAGLVAQLGIFGFFVGIFVTVPYAQAMQGIAMAEYQRVLRPQTASYPLDGSVGGGSGSPFGLKL